MCFSSSCSTELMAHVPTNSATRMPCCRVLHCQAAHLDVQQVHQPQVVRLPPPGVNQHCSSRQAVSDNKSSSRSTRRAKQQLQQPHTFVRLLYLLEPPLGHIISLVPVRMPLLRGHRQQQALWVNRDGSIVPAKQTTIPKASALCCCCCCTPYPGQTPVR